MRNMNRNASYAMVLMLVVGLVVFSSCQTVVQRNVVLTDVELSENEAVVTDNSTNENHSYKETQAEPEKAQVVDSEEEIIEVEPEPELTNTEDQNKDKESMKSAGADQSIASNPFFDAVSSASRIGSSAKLAWIDQNGDEQNLASYGGKVYLIDVWAEWCGPCKMSTGALKQLYGNYRYDGLSVIGVNIDTNSSLKTAKTYATDSSIDYPILSDPEGENVGGVFVQRGIPNFTLIDSEGNIILEHVGAIQIGDSGYKEIENAIKTYIGK
jgi:thiol-disulfide isomerase/thioredoxin